MLSCCNHALFVHQMPPEEPALVGHRQQHPRYPRLRVSLVALIVTLLLQIFLPSATAFGSYLLDEWRCDEPLVPGAYMMGSETELSSTSTLLPTPSSGIRLVAYDADSKLLDRYEYLYEISGPGTLEPTTSKQQVGCNGKRIVGKDARKPRKMFGMQ